MAKTRTAGIGQKTTVQRTEIKQNIFNHPENGAKTVPGIFWEQLGVKRRN
jgi:hypothetical protein